MTITKTELLTTGKAKQVFATTDPDTLWLEYLDQATALNGKKKVAIAGKGTLNLQISSRLFQALVAAGLPTHYVGSPTATSMLVRKCTMIRLEAVVRNQAAGSFAKKFGVAAGQPLTPAVHEWYLKSDALDDPFINDEQVQALGLADADTLMAMRGLSDQVNAVLTTLFAKHGINLVDFKLEFGRLADGRLVVADELSPDNMRLVDVATGADLDKDVFRQDQGPLTPVYAEVLQRLEAAHV